MSVPIVDRPRRVEDAEDASAELSALRLPAEAERALVLAGGIPDPFGRDLLLEVVLELRAAAQAWVVGLPPLRVDDRSDRLVMAEELAEEFLQLFHRSRMKSRSHGTWQWGQKASPSAGWQVQLSLSQVFRQFGQIGCASAPQSQAARGFFPPWKWFAGHMGA